MNRFAIAALLALALPARADDDPHKGKFTIEEATKGLTGKGKLRAELETSLGSFSCELYDKKTPRTVANFVGLARGLRAFRDPATGKWVKRPFFDGLAFHRVIPNFMIQGGDPLGTGSGDPGYRFDDEIVAELRHERGGLLSMANRGPGTNGSQFFVTEVATPWLDGKHTIFGACEPVDLVKKIARVPSTASRPDAPVVLKKVTIRRK
jgi:peptidyl-prolyl cis-trans isomerase A (cyclophilin A)